MVLMGCGSSYFSVSEEGDTAFCLEVPAPVLHHFE